MSGIEIKEVRPLKPEEAVYVYPLRVKYDESGKSKVWDCTKVHDMVSVILYNKTRDVLVFVKQLRPPVKVASSLPFVTTSMKLDLNLQPTQVTGYTIDLAAGCIDKKGKSNEEVTKEEILEETGYDVDVDSIKFVTSFRCLVGVTGSLHYLYYCEVEDKQRATDGGGIGDEQIQVIEMKPEEAKKLLFVKDEECQDSRPCSLLFALCWFFFVHNKNGDN